MSKIGFLNLAYCSSEAELHLANILNKDGLIKEAKKRLKK